jgi:hypothetical protein
MLQIRQGVRTSRYKKAEMNMAVTATMYAPIEVCVDGDTVAELEVPVEVTTVVDVIVLGLLPPFVSLVVDVEEVVTIGVIPVPVVVTAFESTLLVVVAAGAIAVAQ